MREIKFRAWDKSKRKLLQVELWDFKKGCDLRDSDGKGYYSDDSNLEFMQYTGLKDRHGKEIYEGDLLKKKDSETVRVVKWTDQNGAYFVLSNSATEKVDWDDCLTNERIKIFGYEVIGNIYENPELLKDKGRHY